MILPRPQIPIQALMSTQGTHLYLLSQTQCWLVFIANLTETRVTGEERPPIEELPSLLWPAGSAIPRHVILADIKIVTKHGPELAHATKLCSSVFCIESLLSIPPRLSSVLDCYLDV